MSTNQNKRLTDAARQVLAENVGSDRMARRDDFTAAGIPPRHAEQLSRTSKRITSAADLDEAIEDYADRLELEYRDTGTLDPAELAKHVRRGW